MSIHPYLGRFEVVHVQEQANPFGKLGANRALLTFAVGLSQKQPGVGAGWPHNDPSFRSAVVGCRRRVLDQLESKRLDVEVDRLVVVVDDDRGQCNVHLDTVDGTIVSLG